VEYGDGTGPQPLALNPDKTFALAHVYADEGSYTVTVTVTDSAGLSSTATATLVVKRNLVLNPGFETDLSGWNTSGSGANVALTRVAGGHSGGWAASLANNGTSASTCTLNDSPNWVAATSAGTYTAALWVRGATSGATLKLRLREYSGSTLVGTALSQVTLSTSWQQVAVTYVPGAAGSSTLDLNAYVVNAAPGTCFLADDASIYRS
jgi:PKD repeat protein